MLRLQSLWMQTLRMSVLTLASMAETRTFPEESWNGKEDTDICLCVRWVFCDVSLIGHRAQWSPKWLFTAVHRHLRGGTGTMWQRSFCWPIKKTSSRTAVADFPIITSYVSDSMKITQEAQERKGQPCLW